MTVGGNVSGSGEIQIDGTVKGDVEIDGVIVGDTGIVDGDIVAETVDVRGKVCGSIIAKQVRLSGGCHIEGDITHERMAIESGAWFQGSSLHSGVPDVRTADQLVRPDFSRPPSVHETGDKLASP